MDELEETKDDEGLHDEDDLLDTKKKGLLDDEEETESLDDLKDDELAVDPDDLMDDVEEM